jgi:rSAM/selenodomain-associated transferase 1
MHNHLVIMAKHPGAGRVKTRLAAGIGVAECLRVYRTILTRTLRELSGDARWHTWIAVAPDTAVASPVWPPGVRLIGQGTGDLGARMQAVFDRLPRGPVLIIGADIPGIRKSDIAEGFAALGRHDAVFGPAPDGGYWLIGQRRMPKILHPFTGVRWSTDHALADTMENLAGNRVAMLRERADLDTESDYLLWLRR